MTLDIPTHSDEQDIDQPVTVPPAVSSRADAVRHRLTPAQRREIAQLYAESGVSVAELRKRYPISAPSVYRILQTEGVELRGRGATNGRPKRAPKAQSRKRTARSTTRVARSASNGTTQFRIEYVAQRTLYAADFRDALRQAESLGASNIVGLTRIT